MPGDGCAAASPTGAPHCANVASSPRQILVGPTLRIACLSVVTPGSVHVRVTRSPLRVARKSEGGFGNARDGGCGGPIVAHAVNINSAPIARKNVSVERLMRKKQTTRPPPLLNESRTAWKRVLERPAQEGEVGIVRLSSLSKNSDLYQGTAFSRAASSPQRSRALALRAPHSCRALCGKSGETTSTAYPANSFTASRNTFVCRSTSSASVCGDISAML